MQFSSSSVLSFSSDHRSNMHPWRRAKGTSICQLNSNLFVISLSLSLSQSLSSHRFDRIKGRYHASPARRPNPANDAKEKKRWWFSQNFRNVNFQNVIRVRDTDLLRTCTRQFTRLRVRRDKRLEFSTPFNRRLHEPLPTKDKTFSNWTRCGRYHHCSLVPLKIIELRD